jgi:hypothetical protein
LVVDGRPLFCRPFFLPVFRTDVLIASLLDRIMGEKETWQRMNKEERLRNQLELQSRQIERVFSTHQVSARVAGGQIETQSIRFDLQSHLESGLHRLRGLKRDLLSVLGVADVNLI